MLVAYSATIRQTQGQLYLTQLFITFHWADHLGVQQAQMLPKGSTLCICCAQQVPNFVSETGLLQLVLCVFCTVHQLEHRSRHPEGQPARDVTGQVIKQQEVQ